MGDRLRKDLGDGMGQRGEVLLALTSLQKCILTMYLNLKNLLRLK